MKTNPTAVCHRWIALGLVVLMGAIAFPEQSEARGLLKTIKRLQQQVEALEHQSAVTVIEFQTRMEALTQQINDLQSELAAERTSRQAGDDQASGQLSGLSAQVRSLQADLASEQGARQAADGQLNAQVGGLATQIGSLQSSLFAEQSARLAADADLQSRLEASQVPENLLDLAGYVSLETDVFDGIAGPHIIFTGANLHIRSGSGRTDDFGAPTGLGNLIVGYNELRGSGDIRSGAHNIVVGTSHNFSSHGGSVAGNRNTISGAYATVGGGESNTASGPHSSVSGGYANTASGLAAGVGGGNQNTASGRWSRVSGGLRRSVSGDYDWRAGGSFQTQ